MTQDITNAIRAELRTIDADQKVITAHVWARVLRLAAEGARRNGVDIVNLLHTERVA
jgi:hypothetical protein